MSILLNCLKGQKNKIISKNDCPLLFFNKKYVFYSYLENIQIYKFKVKNNIVDISLYFFNKNKQYCKNVQL